MDSPQLANDLSEIGQCSCNGCIGFGPCDLDPMSPDDGDHCEHRGRASYEDDWDDSDDYCAHCECCCTCLGCEYGPRDGMLMFPVGAFGQGSSEHG